MSTDKLWELLKLLDTLNTLKWNAYAKGLKRKAMMYEKSINAIHQEILGAFEKLTPSEATR